MGVVQDATGTRFWLRRKTPVLRLTACGLWPGFTSTYRSARIAVIFVTSLGPGVYWKISTAGDCSVLTTSLAAICVFCQPPEPDVSQVAVENDGGGLTTCQVCCSRMSGARPLTTGPTQ